MLNNDLPQFSGIGQANINRIHLTSDSKANSKAGIEPATLDSIIHEIPIALSFNGISHSTMLLTPVNLEDFVYGFAYTEGIITHAEQIHDIEIEELNLGLVLHVTIASRNFNELKIKKRQLTGRTGCGLCGVESLQDVFRTYPVLPITPSTISLEQILQASSKLSEQQNLHQQTGACHAAALINPTGIIQIREDVGRHNALDKLIGYMLRYQINASQHAIMVSSRASFEMVQKTVSIACPILAAISAPTTLAINTATAHNLSLIGFTKTNKAVVYSQHQRWQNP